MPTPNDRLACFTAIFGAHYAKQLCKGTYQELLDACDHPEHKLMADMRERKF